MISLYFLSTTFDIHELNCSHYFGGAYIHFRLHAWLLPWMRAWLYCSFTWFSFLLNLDEWLWLVISDLLMAVAYWGNRRIHIYSSIVRSQAASTWPVAALAPSGALLLQRSLACWGLGRSSALKLRANSGTRRFRFSAFLARGQFGAGDVRPLRCSVCLALCSFGAQHSIFRSCIARLHWPLGNCDSRPARALGCTSDA